MAEEKVIQKFPSTAHYENGKYIPCPTNQPFAYQDSGAQPIADHKHPIAHAGYCLTHKVLGCTAEECN